MRISAVVDAKFFVDCHDGGINPLLNRMRLMSPTTLQSFMYVASHACTLVSIC